ncbi:PAS domain S-box protein [Cytophagales bacterium LB-30]|uniref:PAS domain S-box protein n=1 Tax=Shiella aurantiaca TaxID=3058365 RepID=A0ABT8F6P6_9BACT|nr:PAS domain S-box protein [Shiella aurantiaca]MDN4165909.1 PAS domain S-box protein [Shiella aurantiaca]
MFRLKDVKISLALLASVLLIGALVAVPYLELPYAHLSVWLLGAALVSVVLYITQRFWHYWKTAITLTRQLLADELRDTDIPQKKGVFALLFSNIRSILYKFNEAATLIHAIGEKGQSLQMKHLDANDRLGKAIVEVQEKMNTYRAEEERRNWGIRGLANFSELLRQQDDNLQEFSAKLIAQVVKYLGANQGSFFVAKSDSEGPYLELMGAYAYDKRKYVKKRVAPGEGLIGQCMLEKDLIYLTDIPKNYIEITSGLGHALPTNIVIVPLINNEDFQGAMELATFHPLQKHELSFLQDLAKSIASSIASTKINEQTQHLLKESQALTQELQHREEEMRQSMEELSATQEEMRRKQIELDGVFGAINNSLITAEVGLDGYFLSTNEALVTLLGVSYEDVKRMSHGIMFESKEEKDACWEELLRGEAVNIDHYIVSKFNSVFWLSASYSPVLNSEGRLYKVLMLAHDITAKKEQEKEFERLSLVADNTDNSVVITNKEGLVEYVNKGFTKMTGYSLEEMQGKKPGSILQGPETNQETVQRIRERLKRSEPIYEEILNYNKKGETYWVSIAINPVKDKDGAIYKFISVQADITETKKSALDSKYKLEAISRSNAVIEFDTHGTIIDVNENFLKIVGYDLEELIGQHHSIFVSESEKISAGYQDFWEQLSEGNFIQGEFTRIQKDGKKICLRGVYNPIYDIHGKPYKIVKFATDITREKALKAETEKQEAELKSHMEAINKTIASVEFSMNGHISSANEIYLSITGYSSSDLQGKHYNDIIPKEEVEKPQNQLMWQSLQEGQFFSGEYKQIDSEGRELWLNGTFNPIFNEEGKPYKVMLFAQFTTKEKEKQNELNGLVSAFKGILPIIEFSEEGVFKNANDLYFQESGFKRLELRQKSFQELIVPKSSQFTFEKVISKCAEQGFCEQMITLKTQNGENKYFKTRFSVSYTLEHRVSKIILILVEQQKLESKKENLTLN